MLLSLTQIEAQLKSWAAAKRTVPLSMNFVGTIQVKDSAQVIQQKLKALDKKQSLDVNEQEDLPTDTKAMPEDFVEVTYRALSATVLADRPVDFSNEAVLKKGTKLLLNQTVYKDHETSVDNWVGKVIETAWDKDTKGIPPGINAKLRLDSVKDPMIVRGVLQGALHSASVTVSFEWEPSHKELMEAGSFFQHLGEEIDGELVRIVVTRLEKFWEISLVWNGADQFAKQIDDDGNVVNAEAIPAQSLSVKNTLTTNKEDTTMDALLKLLKQAFGSDVTAENFEAVFKAKLEAEKKDLEASTLELSKSLDEAKAKLGESKTELETLTKKVAELDTQAKIGLAYLEETRAEAIKLYKLSASDKTNEVILKTLTESSFEIVKAWRDEFKTQVEDKFPLKCDSCQSKSVSRQSSAKLKDDPKTEEKVEKRQVVSDEQIERLKDLHK